MSFERSLFKHRELKKPASKNVCPMRYLNPFLYLHYSTKIAAKSAVIKAILKYPRKDSEGGLFNDQDNAMVFLPVLQDLYPEETITHEDFIFTCNKESLRKYRQPILRFIGPQSIEKQSKELQSVIEDTIQYYTARDSKIGSGDVGQPLNLCPASTAKLFKFSCFSTGCAWHKFRAPPFHVPIFESLSV